MLDHIDPDVIWIASYPRSGNTYLRTILHQCFGAYSTSHYEADLGHNRALETYVGHVDLSDAEAIELPAGKTLFIKTHERPPNADPAIYVVRDGRAAVASLYQFANRTIPLEDIILGRTRFGTWADHLRAWAPRTRANTLFLRYEDLVGDLQGSLDRLQREIGMAVLRRDLPSRDTIAGVDGRWVRRQSDWRDVLTEDHLALFFRVNGAAMAEYGYESRGMAGRAQ